MDTLQEHRLGSYSDIYSMNMYWQPELTYKVYTVHSVHRTNTVCTVHSVHQGSPTYGPRAKRGPFQKNFGPFQILRSKKGHQKNLEEMAKKYELMALNKKGFKIFPFFGPPTTKGWRPLVYTVYCTLYSVRTAYNDWVC